MGKDVGIIDRARTAVSGLFAVTKMNRKAFIDFVATAVTETNRLLKAEKDLAAEQVKNDATRDLWLGAKESLEIYVATDYKLEVFVLELNNKLPHP